MFTQLNSLRSLRFVNDLALNSAFALRLVFIKLLSVNGDGEIRTLDPLLARQVLSQLSYTPIKLGCWSTLLRLSLYSVFSGFLNQWA